jgi:hypothetical protein
MSGWRKRQIMEKDMCGVNRAADKETFVQQYVLARASVQDTFDAMAAVWRASVVWETIHEESTKTTFPVSMLKSNEKPNR